MKQVGTVHRWAVVFVEYGDSVDGKGRILGMYPSLEDAVHEMGKAAENYKVGLCLDDIEYHGKSVSVGSTDECGCEYSIEEIDVPLYDGEISAEEDSEENHLHEASITLRQWELRKYDDIIRSEGTKKVKEFLEREKLSAGDCAASWEVNFNNGYKGEIRVIVGDDLVKPSLYAEAILYDGYGTAVAFTSDPSYDLDGQWNLYAGDEAYEINVFVGN